MLLLLWILTHCCCYYCYVTTIQLLLPPTTTSRKLIAVNLQAILLLNCNYFYRWCKCGFSWDVTVEIRPRYKMSMVVWVVAPCSCSFDLWPIRWRTYFPPKRRALPDLLGITTRKIVFFTVTAVRTSNPSAHYDSTLFFHYSQYLDIPAKYPFCGILCDVVCWPSFLVCFIHTCWF
jgi:hypothetical protein